MKTKVAIAVIVGFILILLAVNTNQEGENIIIKKMFQDKTFNLLVNPDNKDVESDLQEFAKDNKIKLEITYADDLEIVDILEEGDTTYDGVWLSNSVWLYMLNNVTTSDSKSININPVVFGIDKKKAQELGFVGKDIYNKDIVDAIRAKKLNYVMTSVTKTNTGLIAYLGFLNSLAGSPEILTKEMLNNRRLIDDLKALYSGVSRESGSTSFLEDMFLKSNNYDSVVATESSLIRINKELAKRGKTPLYLLYPVDGVSLNDSPFAYVDHGQDKKEDFLKLQAFLLSNEEQHKLEEKGKRTWYGGINKDADSNSFKKGWGIDTTKYINASKYPSKEVINEAINLYINELRKPVSIAFCLDYSGSMYGNGDEELKSAMDFILTKDKASEEYLQFSKRDKIYVLPFSSYVLNTWQANNGEDTETLKMEINKLTPSGGTNIYDCSKKALELVNQDSNEYAKTVILMTDGESNDGSYYSLELAYKTHYSNNQIPIYSIMFGAADSRQLEDIANLTNAKVFDGRKNLISAFKEVRSYN